MDPRGCSQEGGNHQREPHAHTRTTRTAPCPLRRRAQLRNHDDSREGREAVALKLEHAGFDLGRRYAER